VELTAEDVRWALDRTLAFGALGAWRWKQLAGLESSADVSVLDRYTLRLRLRRPHPYLDAYFFSATPMLTDSTTILAAGAAPDSWGSTWLSENNVAGFGPYRLVDLDSARMEFSARDDYWDGPFPAPGISVESVGSRGEALAELDSKAPVYLVGLRCDEVESLGNREDLLKVRSVGGHTSIEMNYHRAPFDDVRVRHALCHATPYGELIDKGLLGWARPWRSPLTTFDAGYTDRFWAYEPDFARATSLLRAAGYGSGFATALYVPNRPDAERLGALLVAAYARIGVELTVRYLETLPVGWVPPLYLRMECGHNFNEPSYDLAHDYVTIDPILPAPGMSVGIGTWFPRYIGSPELENRYRDLLLSETVDDREARITEFQKWVVEFAPSIFVAENIQVNVANSRVGAWVGDHTNRLVQTMQFQNCGTSYLPQA
jgi:ABC-type transport system substrate-binding protein